jgi:TFIIF-interacting CTD phosphatase-like protein
MGTTKKDINICLDLDQTLIWAGTDKEYNPAKEPVLKKKAKKFPNINMDNYYTVFERPGLQDFLDFLFKHFNVSVWTAASKDYALFVIKNIIYKKNIQNRKLDWIFFSYHCDISKRDKDGTKDLRLLWENYKLPGFSKSNTYIIDDYDEVYETQPANCIAVSPFNFTDDGNESDCQLKNVQEELEIMLSEVKKGKKYTASNINKKLKVITK